MFILSIIPLTKIPLPSPQVLDYFSPGKVACGGIVEISLHFRKMLGIVFACAPVRERKLAIKKSAFRLKSIENIINTNEVIPKTHLKLIFWSSEYFYAPLGLTAKTLLPQIFSKPTKKFLRELEKITPIPPSTAVPWHGSVSCPSILLYWNHNLQSKISFYKKALSEALTHKKQALFLIPELYKIEYFQKKIHELKNATRIDGKLSAAKEYQSWQAARINITNCHIGTRSVLAVPLPNLGLVIIDEEESPFYKSFDQQPYLHAREVALKLAEFTGAKVILGSSLPSVESYWKGREGEYVMKTSVVKSSPHRRYPKETQKSKVQLIDMREELKAGNYSILSKELQTKIKNAIQKERQILLFINRKGFASGLLCRDCGHIVKCPNCDVPFVFHVASNEQSAIRNQLICHHCGKKQMPPPVCPQCKSYRIKYIGTGTERVQNELERILNLPVSSIGRLDLDVAPTWDEQKKILDDFNAKKYQILIGTQLMLKEELLIRVELAAIITLDPLLGLPDFRVSGQVMRIISRLSSISEQLIVQTYNPLNPILSTIDNEIGVSYISWLNEELKNREALSFPPFSQLIKLTYAHKNPQKAEREAKIVKNKLQTQAQNYQLPVTNYQLLGPAPAFIARVKNRYIWQIMIKSKIEDTSLRNKLLRVAPSDWKIDVEPVEML